MNQICKSFKLGCLMIIGMLQLLPATIALAQEGTKEVKVDVNVGGDGGGQVWYGQWWVWVVGLAVFIIIIVAITRGGSNKTSS